MNWLKKYIAASDTFFFFFFNSFIDRGGLRKIFFLLLLFFPLSFLFPEPGNFCLFIVTRFVYLLKNIFFHWGRIIICFYERDEKNYKFWAKIINFCLSGVSNGVQQSLLYHVLEYLFWIMHGFFFLTFSLNYTSSQIYISLSHDKFYCTKINFAVVYNCSRDQGSLWAML